MTDHRAVMQQALGAIENYIAAINTFDDAMNDGINVHGALSARIGATDAVDESIAALRQALAATPAPVAQPLSDEQASLVWPIAQDKWNVKADGRNQWDSLGRDEMSLLICREVEILHGITGEVKAS